MAEKPRYPLIQASLEVIRQRTNEISLYERITPKKDTKGINLATIFLLDEASAWVK